MFTSFIISGMWAGRCLKYIEQSIQLDPGMMYYENQPQTGGSFIRFFYLCIYVFIYMD